MIQLQKCKSIALVAHDTRKKDLIDWCRKHSKTLEMHKLSATGTTGQLLQNELNTPIHRYLSGPLGGDLQIGSAVVEGKIDMLIFFWDPLESLPHDPDVKALLRLATMWNIPMACNEASADFFVTSTLMGSVYDRNLNSIDSYKAHRATKIFKT